jgi:D-beta-D-heptose 7-phosphate kinase/D-beta-D-heptose 1-phosphate adenosyltransferase
MITNILATCNGCFDGLHQGHLFFLGFCSAQADSLIVGINTDEYIKRKKGRDPFYSVDIRRKALLSLGFIQDVFVFEENTPNNFIRKINPDIHCTGSEYGEDCPERCVCDDIGASLVLIPRIKHWASSKLDDEAARNVKSYMDRLIYES